MMTLLSHTFSLHLIYTLTKGSLTPHGLATCSYRDRGREGRDAIHFIHGLLRLRGTYCSLIIHELLLLFISPTTLVFM